MKYRPLDNDSWRVHFSTEEYRELLDAAPHRPAKISMRIMSHSPRVGTTSEILLNQFNKKETPHGDIWTLYVEAKDSTERDGATRPREVWICDDLIDEIKEFAGVSEFTEPEPLFHVKKRTIQNWVKKAAENAAMKTGDEDFLKVSSHDFRRYFASHFLYRHNVDAEYVRQLGGWQSPRAMKEYLLLPDDVLAEELGSVGLLGAAADTRSSDGVPYREDNAIDTLSQKIEDADHAGQRRLANRVSAMFDDVSDVHVEAAGSSSAAKRAAEAKDSEEQLSFSRMDELNADDSGWASTAATAKMAYLACVIFMAWMFTFGPFA